MCPLVVMSRKIQKIRNIAGIVQENEHFILSPVHALVCGSAPGGNLLGEDLGEGMIPTGVRFFYTSCMQFITYIL
jgi:hypothetical protein